MKNLAKWWALGLLGLSSVISSSCTSETQSKNISDEDSTAAVPVEIATANTGDISAYYSSTTVLEADEQAMVVAKVRGIVHNLYVEEGDFVKAGTVLAQLEDEQLELEARRARATMDRLKNELDRKEELYRKQLISAQEFENAKYEYQAQKSDYELAQLQMEYSRIRAPISGVISRRMVKVGNMVNIDQEAFQVTDFDPLLAVVNIPEYEMNKLKIRQAAFIQVDAIDGETFQGDVLRISPTVDTETGTFKVTISVEDETRQLKPGMFGRVRIIYDTRQDALMVPKNSVLSEDGVTSVYVVNNSLAYRKTVRTGYANGDNIEILEGLSPADTVVTTGQNSLQDSSLVEIISY